MAIHSPVVRFATRSIPMSRPSSPVSASRSGQSGQRQISAISNSGSCSAMRMKSCSNHRPFSDWSLLSLRIRARTSPALGRPRRSRLICGVGMVEGIFGLASGACGFYSRLAVILRLSAVALARRARSSLGAGSSCTRRETDSAPDSRREVVVARFLDCRWRSQSGHRSWPAPARAPPMPNGASFPAACG